MTFDGARRYTNTYEVVFRKRTFTSTGWTITSTEYWRGEAAAAQGYISIVVPVGEDFDVLLLAGYNRTLLGAGYKTGVDIEADQANTVTMTVQAFPVQWDAHSANVIVYDNNGATPTDRTKSKNDFEFAATIAAYTSKDPLKIVVDNGERYVHVAPVYTTPDPELGPSKITNSSKFKVTFNIAKFEPLIEADMRTVLTNDGDGDATDGDDGGATRTYKKIDDGASGRPGPGLTVEAAIVRLWPRYTADLVSPVDFAAASPNIIPAAIGAADGIGGIITEITETSTIFFTNRDEAIGLLPSQNVDMLLQFEAEYYAYGDPKTKGFRWVIRNGLYGNSEDIGSQEDGSNGYTGKGIGNGSDILVRFGSGTPADNRTDETRITWGW
jgi:hypothetical protein